MCVPDVVQNIHVKVFNLMSWSNQATHTEWHETCKCKCILDASFCNNKQRWNEHKYGYECREELIDKGRCDKGIIWNPSDCECECDRSCDIGEYLDYKSCKCRKRIVAELGEEGSENADENEMIYNGTLNVIPLNDYKKVCGCCTIYIVLFAILFILLVTSTIISSVFIYLYWYLKKNVTNGYY